MPGHWHGFWCSSILIKITIHNILLMEVTLTIGDPTGLSDYKISQHGCQKKIYHGNVYQFVHAIIWHFFSKFMKDNLKFTYESLNGWFNSCISQCCPMSQSLYKLNCVTMRPNFIMNYTCTIWVRNVLIDFNSSWLDDPNMNCEKLYSFPWLCICMLQIPVFLTSPVGNQRKQDE